MVCNTTGPQKDHSESYIRPFLEWMRECPTAFHIVNRVSVRLVQHGYMKLSERDLWQLERGGKYYVERNGSAVIAFVVGTDFDTTNGAALITGHIDTLTAKLKPSSKLSDRAGFQQLAIAPYAGALNPSWLDRDLSIAGRVLVRNQKTGKVQSRLVDLRRPIAYIPGPTLNLTDLSQRQTLPYNIETTMIPIVGLCKAANLSSIGVDKETFASKQPESLVRAVCKYIDLDDPQLIANWELELYDLQAATLGGLDEDLIFAGRLDDKLCSFAAFEAFVTSSNGADKSLKAIILLDDEEIGSELRQGSMGNFTCSVLARICEAFSPDAEHPSDSFGQMCASSFLIAADITHAGNPNFLETALENHSPRLNVGPVICCDGSGGVTTDSMSITFVQAVARKCDARLQIFQVRNDVNAGGSDGPNLSSQLGVRTVDMGLPQLSAHNIRSMTGSLDPGLGVRFWKAFYEHFEEVNAGFEEGA